jgi:photoactive yellow protein
LEDAMEMISFAQDDIENQVSKMSTSELNNMNFGAIKLDKSGKVLQYNAAEGEITGRDPKEVVGKNFFDEVAPCTKTDDFYGKFKEGVASGKLNVLFEYEFDYKMSPTRVKVHMKNALVGDDIWVFVKRR